jgi:hypothetical protein
MQRALIITGLIILAVGLAWPFIGKLPLGRLPDDIVIDRPGFKLYFPLTTGILISLALSFLAWLFRK